MIGRRYFAFLRAINTGERRLTNDEIIAPFVRLGFEDVAAYQAAGNVTFRSEDSNRVHIKGLEAALKAAFGYHTPVFVRSLDELQAIVDARPFAEHEIAKTEGRVQVTFLRAVPHPGAIALVEEMVPADDKVVFTGREWHWLPVRGISDSQLPVGTIESLLGAMTMRTLGTLSRMLAKFTE